MLLAGSSLTQALGRYSRLSRIIFPGENQKLRSGKVRGIMRVESERDIQCSFCGKGLEEVAGRMIGGARAFICIECVALCNKIIKEVWPKAEREQETS